MLSNNCVVGFPTITLSSPGQIAFTIGSLSVRWYGVFIALAFLACYFIAEYLIKKSSLSFYHFHNLVFLILVFSIVFARLYFVILSWDYFKDHLSEIPKIWLGGQSIHGGILGSVLASFIYTKLRKISFYSYIDIAAVIAPLGQAIGRWGNFFNNEAFGIPASNIIFRLYIPHEYRPHGYFESQYFHPVFLYESFLNFVIFVFLFRNYKFWRENKGRTFWTYLLSYSVVRFFLEFLRVDSIYLFPNIAYAHVVSIIIVLVSVFALNKR